MHLLLDTHTLLWWLEENSSLPRSARKLIANKSNDVLVSAASAWEIATKVRLGKLPVAIDLAHDFSGYLQRERFETLAVSTIFVFRRRIPDAPRPYRCVGYPWVPIVYIIILALVTIATFVGKPGLSLVGVGFIAAGGLVYYLFLRPSDPTPAPQELVNVR